MNLNRLFTSLLLTVVSMVCVNATETDDIRKELEHAQGNAKLELLGRLYESSMESGDYPLMWRNLHEYLKEAQRQGDKSAESLVRYLRIEMFYNNDQSDSIYHYAPDDLAFIHENGSSEKYYEAWSCLVNTYVYDGSLTTGLKEAEKMYNQAKENKNDFGSGLACYVMGNAYYNMNNLDEASEIYQRGIDLLMQQTPIPLVLAELFSSECDVLEKQGRYDALEKLTVSWRNFLEQFVGEMKLERDYPGMLPNWAYYYLGCAQAALGLGNMEKAEECLEEARKKISSEDSALYRSWLFFRVRYMMMLEFYPEALLLSDQLLPLYEESGDMAEFLRAK